MRIEKYPDYVPKRYDPETSYFIMQHDKDALRYYLEEYITR